MNKLIFSDYVKKDEKILEIGDIVYFKENQEENNFIITKDYNNKIRLLNRETLVLDEITFETIEDLYKYIRTKKFSDKSIYISKNFEWTIYFP